MLSSHPCSSEGVLLLSSFLSLPAAVPVAVAVAFALALFFSVLLISFSFTFHLASNGCNMWEMKLTEGLQMLWMHVDGSP